MRSICSSIIYSSTNLFLDSTAYRTVMNLNLFFSLTMICLGNISIVQKCPFSIFKFHLIFNFRNPNKPTPVRMFWPEYTKENQHYLHITREMTSASVKSNLLSSEYNLWRNIIPAVFRAVEQSPKGYFMSTDTG